MEKSQFPRTLPKPCYLCGGLMKRSDTVVWNWDREDATASTVEDKKKAEDLDDNYV